MTHGGDQDAHRWHAIEDARKASREGRAPEAGLSLVESGSGFLLTVELPEVEKKDLRVEVAESEVTIRGRGTTVIPLPAPVKAAEARASFRDRVLKISVPRIAPSQVRRIEIE